jgi:hypothetical protein
MTFESMQSTNHRYICGGSPPAFAVEDLSNTNGGTATRDLFVTVPVLAPAVQANAVLDGIYTNILSR